MPPKSANVGGQNPEFVLREFGGMNVIDAREAINDNEFAWVENAIPVGNAALYPIKGAGLLVSVGAETTAPTYTMTFAVAGVDYSFSVWALTGNAYVINLSALAVTLILTGLVSGRTYATAYNNQGVLIIDPTGYWDWGVTTANVLTPQNGSLAFATVVTASSIAIGTSLEQVWLPGSGSGGTWQNDYQVVRVTINAAGTGYAVGDAITLIDGTPTVPAQIIVASVGGGGNITGITLATGGNYPGPSTAALVQTGPTGSVTATTGFGTGATFTGQMQAFQAVILTPGNGYPATHAGRDQTALPLPITNNTITSSGVIGGIGIATYAGRVWIASSRTVYFTDINSYFSFGGVGGSFTISDSYLHGNLTALFSANNYLYIFGDTSIDALSNVTVSAGVTSFSRINVTASVGCSTPVSIFAYYRAIIFYHTSGFYLLAGATPEKISEKISALVNQIIANSNRSVYAGQVLVQGELCAAFLFQFTDIFTRSGAARYIFALFFRSRWWVNSWTSGPANTPLSPAAMFSLPTSVAPLGTATLYAWSGNTLYIGLQSSTTAPWLIKTKLWDGGAPLLEKQSINAAIGAEWNGLTPTGVTINVDSEISSASAVQTPLAGNPLNYFLEVTAANMGGGQYIGMTVSGSTDVSKIHMLALRAKAERDMMQ